MTLRYGQTIVTDGLVLCLDAADNISAPHNDLPFKNGLIGWWDASDDSTVTMDGSYVLQLRDKSNSGYHMGPSGATLNQGPLRNTTLNSKKVLYFNSNGRGLGTASGDLNLQNQNYTVIALSRYTDAGGTYDNRVVQAVGNNWLLGHHGSYIKRYYANGWVSNNSTAGDNNFHTYVGTGDISNDFYNFWVDSGNVTGNAGGSQGPNGLSVNAGYDTSEASECELAELIVFNRVITNDERKKIETYLSNKWNRSLPDALWYDKTVNTYNGTPTNDPTYSETNKGYFDFDGTDQYINLGTTAGNFGTDPFTVSIWLKFDVITNFFNKRAADQDQIFFGFSGGKPYFIYNAPNGTDYGYTVSNTSLSTGVWYNLVATVDRSSVYPVIYVNGVNDGSSLQSSDGSPTTANMDNGGSLYLGRWTYANTTDYFNGQMSQVLLYKNKALSATEVLQNYNTTVSRFK